MGGVDLEVNIKIFTWSNGRKVGHRDRVRLDRVISYPSWLEFFSKAGVRGLPASGSDHNPILLDCFLLDEKGRKPFCFYDARGDDPGCRERKSRGVGKSPKIAK